MKWFSKRKKEPKHEHTWRLRLDHKMRCKHFIWEKPSKEDYTPCTILTYICKTCGDYKREEYNGVLLQPSDFAGTGMEVYVGKE